LTNRAIGLAVELYNSTNDPDLTEILANTNVITTANAIYRFDFPSLSTYTGDYATDESITQIVSEGDIKIQDANIFSFYTELTGDVWGGSLSVEGDLTAENLIVDSTNVITEIATIKTTITNTTD
jgi:hypothetical protein